MDSKKIYLLGIGGMAREAYQLCNIVYPKSKICGFVVDTVAPNISSIDHVPVIRTDDFLKLDSKKISVVASIGSPEKEAMINRIISAGFTFVSVVHPSVMIDKTVKIGKGVIINRGVVLTRDIEIGNYSIINITSSISHGCVIGNYCHISPGVHIAGDVTIGDGTWVGIGTTVIQKRRIGNNCMIGAGSVIVEDIPDNRLVYGNPGRRKRTITKKDWKTLLL